MPGCMTQLNKLSPAVRTNHPVHAAPGEWRPQPATVQKPRVQMPRPILLGGRNVHAIG